MSTRENVVAELQHRARAVETESIAIVRELAQDNLRVVFSEFAEASPSAASGSNRMRAVFSFIIEDGRWLPGGSYITAVRIAGSNPANDSARSWDSYGGFTNGDHWIAAGWPAHPMAATVVLTDPAGRQREAQVDNGTALFLWTSGEFGPVNKTEVLDRNGDILVAELAEPG